MSGEVVAMETRPSRIVYLPALFVLIASVFLFWSLYSTDSEAGKALPLPAVLIAVAGFMSLWALYKRCASQFAVTNKRVVVKTGFLHSRSTETMLRQVEGITVDQGIFGKIFDFGTIVIEGTGSDRVPYSRIADPMGFRLTVLEQIEANLAHVAPAAREALRPSNDSVIQLNDLRERGIITDEEFQRGKRRALGETSS
jgi:uncharacterized membrane protein YdbT with pleckstrin-like domain